MKITDWLVSTVKVKPELNLKSPDLNKDLARDTENKSPAARSSSLNKSNSNTMPREKSAEASTSKSAVGRQPSSGRKSGGSASSKQSGSQGSSKQSGSQGSSKQSGSQGSSKQSGSQGSSKLSGDRQSGGQGANTGTITLVAGTHSVIQKPDVVLPQSRVKVIMKSSPEIDQVQVDVAYLITKATELFIDHLTTQTFSVAHRAKNVEYKHLAEMTQKHENLEFLRDIVPLKMTARAALAEVAKQKALASKEILD